MGFTTPSYDLVDLFQRIDRGDLQLPDFQREYRWDVDRIRQLLITVLRGYPIGAMMALDTRNEPMRFRPRALQGAPLTSADPGMLLLDGQQRLTTLYQCLRGDGLVESVDFRNKRVKRRFYVDISRAIEEDIMPDEAVISVDENGEVRSHFVDPTAGPFTDVHSAMRAGFIPVCSLLSDEGTDLLFDLAEQADPIQRERIKRFHNTVVKPLVRYAVPMTRLERETAQAGIGSIFAAANSSGLQMDVFELLTALFAAQDPDFDLRQDWQATEAVLAKFPALEQLDKTAFLSAVALYVSAHKGPASGHRESILNLTVAEYIPAAEVIRAALHEAAHYMAQRCVLSTSQVPYTSQLIPLTVIIALLSEHPGVLSKKQAWDRLNRWFWCGVFGEMYGSPAVMVRIGRDVDQVTAWVRAAEADAGSSASSDAAAAGDVEVPRTVENARFVESRLLSAGPESGLYKGIYALLMGRGAQDWRTGVRFDRNSFYELGTHFRQIFPTSWCEEHGISPVLADSVLNRTPMGRKTHVMVEEASPARYMYRLQQKSLMDDEEFDEVLASHLITPELLLTANAPAFFSDRRRQILAMVEEAMGAKALHDVDEHDLGGGEEGPDAFEQVEDAEDASH